MPFNIHNSGIQRPFNIQGFQVAIERGTSYTSGINLFWRETLLSAD